MTEQLVGGDKSPGVAGEITSVTHSNCRFDDGGAALGPGRGHAVTLISQEADLR